MEYVMCGKLLTYLRERRSRPDRFSGSGALTSRDLTVFAYCVARGMDYIASKGVCIITILNFLNISSKRHVILSLKVIWGIWWHIFRSFH